MTKPECNSTDLVGLVTAQMRDCETTVTELGLFPKHISVLSARYLSILLRQNVIKLPRNAIGVRIRLELANRNRLSRESFDAACELVRAIDVRPPARGTPAHKIASEMFRVLLAPAAG